MTSMEQPATTPNSLTHRWRWIVVAVTIVGAVIGAAIIFTRGDGESTTTQGVTTTLHVDGSPNGIAAVPHGLWVGLTGRVGDLNGALTHLDLVTGEVDKRIPLHGVPSFIRPIGDSLWLDNASTWTDTASGELIRFDPRSGTVQARRRFKQPTFDFAELDGRVWTLVGRNPATVVPLDPKTMKTIGSPITISPSRVISVVSDGGVLWATAAEANKLLRIDPKTRRVTSVSVGEFPVGVVFADGSVWVANRSAGTVTKVDPSTMRVTKTIHVGELPTWMTAADGSVWVASQHDGTVDRIDARTGEKVGDPIRIAPASGSDAAAHIPTAGDGAVWVTSLTQRTVSRIDPRR